MQDNRRRWERVRVERGIYRQPNGNYAVCVMIEGKPRLRTVGSSLEQARSQRELLRAAARRGELPVFPRLTFAEAAACWLRRFEQRVAAGERRERTLEIYRYHVSAHLLPSLGRRHLQAITADDLAELIAALQRKGLSAKTIAGALVPLGSILRFALRRGYIHDDPLRKLEPSERPAIVRPAQRALNRQQLAQLLACSPSRYRPLLATAAYTGMRLSELLGLVWQDVDIAAGTIRVRCQLSRARAGAPARRVPPKTRAAIREIPLAPQLALLLRQHRRASAFAAADDYVFATDRGTPLGHRNVERRALARAASGAGLNSDGMPRLRFHDLRHTFASHLIIDLRLDVAQVSRVLGHASTSITLDTYTHVFDEAAHTREIRSQIGSSEFARLLSPFVSSPTCRSTAPEPTCRPAPRYTIMRAARHVRRWSACCPVGVEYSDSPRFEIECRHRSA